MEEGGKFESIEKGGSVKGPQKCERSPATARAPDLLSAATLCVPCTGRDGCPSRHHQQPVRPNPCGPALAAQPLGPKLGDAHPEPNLAAVEGWLVILTGLHEETQEDDIHDKFCDFGTASSLTLTLSLAPSLSPSPTLGLSRTLSRALSRALSRTLSRALPLPLTLTLIR